MSFLLLCWSTSNWNLGLSVLLRNPPASSPCHLPYTQVQYSVRDDDIRSGIIAYFTLYNYTLYNPLHIYYKNNGKPKRGLVVLIPCSTYFQSSQEIKKKLHKILLNNQLGGGQTNCALWELGTTTLGSEAYWENRMIHRCRSPG